MEEVQTLGQPWPELPLLPEMRTFLSLAHLPEACRCRTEDCLGTLQLPSCRRTLCMGFIGVASCLPAKTLTSFADQVRWHGVSTNHEITCAHLRKLDMSGLSHPEALSGGGA